MYVGFFVGWLGLWVIFGRANLAAITVAFVAVVGIAFFVRLYEEPTLQIFTSCPTRKASTCVV
jgi:hypothetical protein